VSGGGVGGLEGEMTQALYAHMNNKIKKKKDNENTTYQILMGTANAVLSGKFIAMNAHIKRTERYQINDLMIHLKLLEKKNKQIPKQIEGVK
jgi:hypothetical protein